VELLNAIDVKCDNLRTCPILTEILLEGISEWLNGRTLNPYRYDLRYHQLIQEQNDIGWRHVFNGQLALTWSELQVDHHFFGINCQYREAPFRNVMDECYHSGSVESLAISMDSA
jgi:hypothetical protein